MEERRDRRGYTSPREERSNETGKLVTADGSVEFCEATPIRLVDEPKYPCTDARPTETCVAPVNASSSFIYFLRTSSVGGGGGGYSFVIFSLLSRPRAGLATV